MKIHIITNNSHFEVHVSLHGNLRASVLVIIGQGRKEKVADKLCVFEVSCDGGNNGNLRPSFYFGERLREICINWHFSTSILVLKSFGGGEKYSFKIMKECLSTHNRSLFLPLKIKLSTGHVIALWMKLSWKRLMMYELIIIIIMIIIGPFI